MEQEKRPALDAAGNPYARPETPLDAAPAKSTRVAGIVHRVISILIALFCAMQFLSVWTLMLRSVAHYGLDQVSLMFIAKTMLMPFTLALAGVFLVFGRRLSVLLFVAYLMQYAFEYGSTGNMDLLSQALVVAFLAYAVWRWKAGALTGWPRI